MSALETRIPPPLLFLAMACAMWVSAYAGGQPAALGGWRFALAAALAAVALGFALPAFAAFRRAATTINPVDVDRASHLVTGGIYRVTRNPMYVALTLLLVALALCLATPWAALGPIAFALYLTRFQIVPEERALAARFGEAYARYRQQTRRWL